MWGRSRKHNDPEADAVVAEAQALLAGRAADRHSAAADPVPGWAWVNCLAHAGMEDLNGLVDGARIAQPSGWAGAMSFLAHELIATGRTSEGVAELQRAALIPLELDLLSPGTPTPSTPGRLVAVVQARLDDHQRLHGIQ
ncbi:MAG: hypothetical protein ACHQNA_00145 [Acidimicrobiales bacterium]